MDDRGELWNVPLSGTGSVGGPSTFSTVQQPPGQVDLLFDVHTGSGMEDFQAELSETAEGLVSRFEAVSGQFHIGVIGTNAAAQSGGILYSPAGVPPPHYVEPGPGAASSLHDKLTPGIDPGINPVPDQSLESLRLSLLAPNAGDPTRNKGFFRPNTPLAVVIVSNAAERSPAPLHDYTCPLLSPRGSIVDGLQTTRLYGLVSPAACAEHTRYRELVGQFGQQCYPLESGSINQQIMAIADDLLQPQPSFALSAVVDTEKPFQVLVDGAPLPLGTYSLEAGNKVVRFDPQSVPQPGQQIDVTYWPVCQAQNL
jgi:hypothetical protein